MKRKKEWWKIKRTYRLTVVRLLCLVFGYRLLASYCHYYCRRTQHDNFFYVELHVVKIILNITTIMIMIPFSAFLTVVECPFWQIFIPSIPDTHIAFVRRKRVSTPISKQKWSEWDGKSWKLLSPALLAFSCKGKQHICGWKLFRVQWFLL